MTSWRRDISNAPEGVALETRAEVRGNVLEQRLMRRGELWYLVCPGPVSPADAFVYYKPTEFKEVA